MLPVSKLIPLYKEILKSEKKSDLIQLWYIYYETIHHLYYFVEMKKITTKNTKEKIFHKVLKVYFYYNLSSCPLW